MTRSAETCGWAVYGQWLVRTVSANGLVLRTLTALEGASETMLLFLESGGIPGPQTETDVE